MTTGYTIFPTALGHCGIAWSSTGITHVHLPEASEKETDASMASRTSAPRSPAPPWVNEIADRIARSVGGSQEDFGDVPLDLGAVPAFHREVFIAARKLARGSTLTYGGLAERAGSAGAARAVGQAMARNPVPILVPCHRVLGAGGSPGGFTSAGGIATKARLLAAEGITLPGSPAPPSPEHLARGLNYDPVAAAETLARKDKRLGKLIERVGPLAIKADPAQSAFEALARAIVYQQLAGAAAATIFGRVKALFPGGALGSPKELLSLSDTVLRGAGLSGSKLAALRDLSAKSLDGTVPELDGLMLLPDETIVERLTRVRGVGRWTVEMLLIFRLGRPDVLPVNDYGVRKGFQKVYGGTELPDPRDLGTRGLRWRPYRSAAAWYLWRALDG